ncbi:MAG: CBS domain-containing protein [Actinocatenispora sp.]
MRARDLASAARTVTLETPALDAARLLAEYDLPGLVVVDAERKPYTVLPGTQVLRMAVPGYIQDDPALASVVDEAHADLFHQRLGRRTVRECLPARPGELPVVDPDATALEIAALMARTRCPVVAVVEAGRVTGAISLDHLLDRILAS